MIIKPNPRRQPQTRESLHAYVLPPHCRARSKQTMPQIKKKAPTRSISPSFCFVVKPVSFRSGFLKKKKTVARVIPPKGRFLEFHQLHSRFVNRWREPDIQKHHLQVALSVSTPPSIGPMTEEIPNIELKSAMYNARFLSGTEKPTIVIPPENRAAAPMPAIALPMMSMTEFLAAAHTIDPSSNIMRAIR